MARTFALVALLALVAPAGAGHSIRNQRAFLAADMQPEVVARTLMNVEQEWKSEAAIFVECSGAGEGGDAVVDCNEAPKAFAKSCSTVVSAVVRGSNGDKDVVKEYMEDVCGQNSISGWQKDGCVDLAAAVEKIMTADNYENRNNLDASQPCLSFWSRFLETEKARAAKEEAERKEAEKKAAEEAAKQAAEAAKKAKEEAAKAEQTTQKVESEMKAEEKAETEKRQAKKHKEVTEAKEKVEKEMTDLAACKAELEAAKAKLKLALEANEKQHKVDGEKLTAAEKSLAEANKGKEVAEKAEKVAEAEKTELKTQEEKLEKEISAQKAEHDKAELAYKVQQKKLEQTEAELAAAEKKLHGEPAAQPKSGTSRLLATPLLALALSAVAYAA
mmetsp:Transcript_32398/g.59638  ORF Transcript_32398/g.59638 Transcript_32398/m.59638 type:complete len:388 (-) Transcript_32398:48-1211(-)